MREVQEEAVEVEVMETRARPSSELVAWSLASTKIDCHSLQTLMLLLHE